MIPSEFEIIRRYFAESGLQFPRAGVTLGIGDDGALLNVPADKLLVMSMDVLVEGIHFPPQADPALVAQRALAVNLSDLAAMAAEPFCFTLGLTLPAANNAWLSGFSSGLLQLARAFNCPLVGGDISRGPLNIAIQVQGLVEPDRVMRRSGAKVGDQIYVSGSLGDGAIALASLGLATQFGDSMQLQAGAATAQHLLYLHAAYYQPEPRIALAQALAPHVSSGIDISDGLAGDLGHILRANGVGGLLQLSALPFSDAARACMSASNCQRAALYGGDDYELCVTVAPAQCAAAEAAAAATGIAFTRIGVIVAGTALHGVDADGSTRAIEPGAFRHF